MITTWEERKVIIEALTQYVENSVDEDSASERDKARTRIAETVLDRMNAEFVALADGRHFCGLACYFGLRCIKQ